MISDGGIAGSIRERVIEAVDDQKRSARLMALSAVFLRHRQKHRTAFDVGHEIDNYLVPARRAVRAGYKVVVYSHTSNTRTRSCKPFSQQSFSYEKILFTADLALQLPQAQRADIIAPHW